MLLHTGHCAQPFTCILLLSLHLPLCDGETCQVKRPAQGHTAVELGTQPQLAKTSHSAPSDKSLFSFFESSGRRCFRCREITSLKRRKTLLILCFNKERLHCCGNSRIPLLYKHTCYLLFLLLLIKATVTQSLG